MAKYQHNNKKHRLWLANNILTILAKWGFSIDEMTNQNDIWEFVLSKADKYNPRKRILVYTAINKTDGLCRAMGDDRIRIVVDDGNYAKRIKRINRVGEFSAVTSRMIDGILEAQKV